MKISLSFESGSSHGKTTSHLAVPLIFRLQRSVAAKKAIVNFKNEDDECLKWAITRALNLVEKHSEPIDQRLRETSKGLNCKGLKFPVNLCDINKFENHNSSISFNVFRYEKLGLSS